MEGRPPLPKKVIYKAANANKADKLFEDLCPRLSQNILEDELKLMR